MRIWISGLALAISLSGHAAYAHQQNSERWVGWEGEQPGVIRTLVDMLISPAYAEAHIRVDGNYRLISSNGLPEHNTGRFPNANNPTAIREQSVTYRVPVKPIYRESTTPLGMWPFGVAINGVPFDPGAAEFWRGNPRSGWQYEALSGAVDLGVDRNNAHVQPTGSYHYHGLPTGLLERYSDSSVPILLGYAADGFPIYGPYGYRNPIDDRSGMQKLRGSYQVKGGQRPDGPGGRYDGSFVQDYEYIAGLGDLDDCNGRSGITAEYPEGTYYYVVTDNFPFIPRCFHGTPDRSFMRGPGSGQDRAASHGVDGSQRQHSRGMRQPQGGSGGMRRPPQEAIDACKGRDKGDRVSFTTPFGHRISGVCQQRDGELFVIPG
ncbi:YHYH protein [Pontibacterium sp. N1Y112]|uniref:YHYH protein n=1 Tax=Pontibacterium sinense TaxID=2781979 RepID=A0A8J7K8V4_9GAMM|nr:YHYH protein [Pontibacterium sinense]MBE9399431.1 YHYH protein [Pontibacterium sinense]